MGVSGLWQLIAPVGRPIPLETLENKILAIDVSIWLNQAIKGFRDVQGRAQPNAHLLGLFHRICKLLFYKIKPVFVFDGSVPLLKKQTIENRKRTRQMAVDSIEKTAQQILTNIMAKELVNKASSSKSSSPRKAKKATSSRIASIATEDLYWLPPLPKQNSFNESQKIDKHNSENEEDMYELPTIILDSVMEHQFQNLNNIDVESEQFNNLPPDIRCEILSELKERRKRLFYQQNNMPEESRDFSQYQIERLLKRRHLTKKLDEVKKELSSHEAGKLMSHLEGEERAEMLKIASEDSTHTIFIHTSGSNMNHQQAVSQERLQKEISLSKEVIHQFQEPDSPSHDEHDIDSFKNQIILQVIEESKNVQKLNDTEFLQDNEKKVAEVHVVRHAERSNESSEIDDHETGLEKDCLRNSVLDNATTSNTSEIVTESLNVADAEKFTEINKSKQLFTKNEEDYISEVDSPLFSKSEFEQSKEEIYFIDDSSSSSCLQECHEVLQENLCSPRTLLTVTLDTAAHKDDELFPKEMFQCTRSKDIEEPDSRVFLVPWDNNASRKSLQSNLHNFMENEKCPLESDLLKVPLSQRSPVKTNASERNTPPISPKKSRLIEDLFAKKLTPKNFGETTSDSDLSPAKSETPAITALVNMNDDHLQRLENELDSERSLFLRDQRKKERQAQTVSDQIYFESQELLKLFGVPFIVSPTEAEAQCAQLELLGLTHGTITDDSDIWLFGGSKVYKNFFTQGKYLECYTNQDIENQYGLDRGQLICFGLLTGSDYTEGIEGVGPVRAMEVISEFKKDGFETLKSFREWYDSSHGNARPPKNSVRSKLLKLEIPDSFPRQQVYEAYVHPAVDSSKERFSWGLPKLDELRELSREKFGWTTSKVDEMLLPIINRVNERESQTRIDSFFQTSFRKEKNLFPSKRIEKALTKMKPGSSAEIEVEDPLVKGASKTPRKSKTKAKKKGKTGTNNIQVLTKEVNLSEDSSESSCDEMSKSKKQNLNASSNNVSKGFKTAKVPAKKCNIKK